MARKLPKKVVQHLDKCQAAAMSAVESYNRPGPRFRSALYIVLIVIAWLAFFHAYFYRIGRKPWYQSRQSSSKFGVRYKKIDGEPVHWDLIMCLREYYRSSNTPARMNLEFLVGLRNKIEHRDLPQLDLTIYGECQAALMNLEEHLINEFGAQFGLSDSLALSIQFSRIRPSEQNRALKSMINEAKLVFEYIDTFKATLSDEILNDMGYAFRVFLVPKVANRQSSADAAIEFVRLDELDDEQKTTLQNLTVLSKEKHVPISNLDMKKPAEVVKNVSLKLPFIFKMHHHTKSWKYFDVRPPGGSKNAHLTNSIYCVYDSAHKDYLYTSAWVKKLILELTDSDKFTQITGQKPVRK